MPPKKSGRGTKKAAEASVAAEDSPTNGEDVSLATRKRGRAKATPQLSNGQENGHAEGEPTVAKRRGKAASSEAKNAKQATRANSAEEKTEQEPEESPEAAPKKRGRAGRKEQVKEESSASDHAALVGSRVLQVSLLRQKSVDDMALEELKKMSGSSSTALATKAEEEKTTAGGANQRGKRGRPVEEKDAKGKPSKAPKGSAASSGPKKQKVPEVKGALDLSNASTTKSGEPWNLKIASWNVNGVRAWLEKCGASYLESECPDVLCIQETKCSDAKLPKEANVEGYHCYWLAGDREGYSGVGMMSKEKRRSVEYGIDISTKIGFVEPSNHTHTCYC